MLAGSFANPVPPPVTQPDVPYICEGSQAAQDDEASNKGHHPADGNGGARHGCLQGGGAGRGNCLDVLKLLVEVFLGA